MIAHLEFYTIKDICEIPKPLYHLTLVEDELLETLEACPFIEHLDGLNCLAAGFASLFGDFGPLAPFLDSINSDTKSILKQALGSLFSLHL
jgi:hypothetical protein